MKNIMVTRISFFHCYFKTTIVVFFILCFSFLYSEQTNKFNDDKTKDFIQKDTKDNYHFKVLETGEIEFKQIITWKALFGALYYELTICEKESNEIVIDKLRTKQNTVEVSLKPGFYKYKVDVYNMLSKKEVSSEWTNIEVKKAYMPHITSVSPNTIWIEDNILNLRVYGSDFAPDSEIIFVSDGLIKKTIVLEPKEKTNKYILFHLKKPEIFLGMPYRVEIKDKSGLSKKSEQFFVKYRRPVIFYVGLGYAPIAPLTDSYYKSHWTNKMYFTSFTGDLGLIFSRQSFGYFGIASKNTFRITNLKRDDVVLKNKIFLSTINLVYEYWMIKKLCIYASTGFGIAINSFKFVYDNIPGEGLTVIDPTYNVSFGIRAKLHTFIYLDAVLSVEQILNKNIKPLFIIPQVSIGFRY